jgi:hypothetical protein
VKVFHSAGKGPVRSFLFKSKDVRFAPKLPQDAGRVPSSALLSESMHPKNARIIYKEYFTKPRYRK